MITLEMIKAEILILEQTIARLNAVIDKQTIALNKAENDYINDILNNGKQATYNTLWNIVQASEQAVDRYEKRIYALKELADTFSE